MLTVNIQAQKVRSYHVLLRKHLFNCTMLTSTNLVSSFPRISVLVAVLRILHVKEILSIYEKHLWEAFLADCLLDWRVYTSTKVSCWWCHLLHIWVLRLYICQISSECLKNLLVLSQENTIRPSLSKAKGHHSHTCACSEYWPLGN